MLEHDVASKRGISLHGVLSALAFSDLLESSSQFVPSFLGRQICKGQYLSAALPQCFVPL